MGAHDAVGVNSADLMLTSGQHGRIVAGKQTL